MSLSSRMIGVLLLLLMMLLMLSGNLTAAEQSWFLPDDPQAVVVELKHEIPLQTLANLPPEVQRRMQLSPRDTIVIRIRRNGSFEVGRRGEPGHATGRMTGVELALLLGELIERQRALEISSTALATRVEQLARESGREVGFRDSETAICLTLRDGPHEIRCCAPQPLRTRFPEVRELDRVCAIIRRLENIAAVAQIGGRAEAERLARLATAELRRQNAENMTITADDLVQVRGKAGDLRQAQFVVDPTLTGGTGAVAHVSVMETPGQSPRISMTTQSPFSPL